MTKFEMMEKMYEVLETMCEEKEMAWYTVVEEHAEELEKRIKKTITGLTQNIYDEWFKEVIMEI